MVIYVANPLYDSVFKYLLEDESVVKDGLPDPFVESLQHDSIIVQLPLLRGRVSNRLEQVLSVFDQTNVLDDKKVIRIDDQQFDGDNDMEYIVRRLQSAASDPELRYQMNAEDEFFKEIEDRDTAIMEHDKQLKEKESQIQEKESQIQEKDTMLRSMIEGMLGNGMSFEQIANITGISIETIRQYQ